jgi:hypothetical protein
MNNSALFLDRDGVINVDRGYVHRPDEFEFVPGIFHWRGSRPMSCGGRSLSSAINPASAVAISMKRPMRT